MAVCGPGFIKIQQNVMKNFHKKEVTIYFDLTANGSLSIIRQQTGSLLFI